MNSNHHLLLRTVLLSLFAFVALDNGLLVMPAFAQRSERGDERWGRGDDSGDGPSREEMRRNWERFREMRRAQGGGEGDWGGEGRGGGFRRRGGFGPGGFEGGFGGEGEGREFRRRSGGDEGGGRPESRRNRSDDDEDDDNDNGNEEEEGDRSRRRNREERREERRSGNAAMDPADYARSLLRDRDKNENGTLEGDELRELPSAAASADADKNNVITQDELVERLANRDSNRNGESGRPGTGSAANKDKAASGGAAGMATRVFTALAPGGTGEKSSSSAKRTYRFTPPGERTDLPGWIKSRDRNKNGQVEMSEFGRSWSQRTVNDFRRYDLNDDGIVTAKEAAASGAK
jgi:hypothetical protein